MMETDTAAMGDLRVTVSRDELAQKLAIVARGVSSRSAVQILSGILLRSEGGQLHLAATDMDLSLRASLPARVDGEGAVVVPGKILVDLIRQLPADEVQIEHGADEGVLRIASGSSRSQVNTYAADDFPRLPDLDVPLHGLAAGVVLETIARVRRAASRDESRPVLTGILVRFEPGKLVMAATDSYRLSVKETPLEQQVPEMEAIVPARALEELSRIAAGAETLELGVRENQVIFGADGVWLTTRRIDGQFPNYRQLLPEAFEHTVPVNRLELLDVVRRTSVLAQRNSPLRLRFAEGELVVSSQTQDVGESRESMPVAFTGEPLEIGFNAEFLRDGIDSVEGDELLVNLISPLRPGLLKGGSGDFWYLIMPIRLAG
jgi:DNA polymerase-3 subunit beta